MLTSNFLKFLYVVASIFGIVPLFNFDNCIHSVKLFHRIYSFILSVCWIAIDAIRISKFNEINLINCLILLFHILSVITTISLTFGFRFYHSENWQHLIRNFYFIKLKLYRNEFKSSWFQNPYLYFLIIYFLHFIVKSTILYFKNNCALSFDFNLISNLIFQCYKLFNFILAYVLLETIKECYRFNNLLITNIFLNRTKIMYSIRKIEKTAIILHETVSIYNRIFGYYLLFESGQLIPLFLINTHRISKEEKTSENIAINLLEIVWSWVMFNIIAIQSHSLKNESVKSPRICLALQTHTSNHQTELINLFKTLESTKTQITAADFFNVNKPSILYICTAALICLNLMQQFDKNQLTNP